MSSKTGVISKEKIYPLLKLTREFITRSNILKTIWFNFSFAGNRGRLNKILIYGKSVIKRHSTSKINIENGTFRFNRGTNYTEPFPGMLEMYKNSTINVQNGFSVKSGAHIIVTEGAILNLGSGYINRNVKIKCYSKIEIGEDVAISENVTIWDSDAHDIISSSYPKTKSQPIIIRNHVWIGTNVIILKGVEIGEGSIIAAGAVVNKSIPSNCLAGGVPAKVLKTNVKWEN